MKTNTKRFFNLNPHRNDGFTLVELIVVIAILAILAAVAVPAYSGYIEKANRAGDETLIAAINRAFTSTCVENGVPVTSIDAVSIPVGANGEIGNDASLSETPGTAPKYLKGLVIDGKTATAAQLAAFDDAFAVYFSGNQTAKFKTIQNRNLIFNPLTMGFIDMLNYDGPVQLSYAGEKIQVSAQDVQKLANSTFGTTIGGEKLLGEVAALTGWADTDGNAIVEKMGDEYYYAVAGYMGMTGTEMETWFNSGDLTDAQIDAIMTNGLVLYAAEKSASMTTESIQTLLNSGNIYGNLSSDPATQLAQASMVYGLYTGYINSDFYKGEVPTTTDPVAAVKTVSSDNDFKTYVNSAQGEADLEAYISAMGIINSSAQNDVAMKDVLLNGYDNQELVSLLEQALGK